MTPKVHNCKNNTSPIVKFGDVVRNVKAKVDPETSGLTRYVAGEHMVSEDLHIRRWGEIGDGYLGPAFRHKFVKGQVLYGSRRTYLKKVAVAPFDGITANTTFVLEPKDDRLIPELLPFIMQTDAFNEHSIRESKGSVNPYILWKDIAWYTFPLPPKDEQRRIAEILWAADEVVERQKKAVDDTKRMKASFLSASVKYCTTMDSSSPHGYAEVRFTDIVDIDPPVQRNIHNDTAVTFLSMADLAEGGGIASSSIRPYAEVRNGYTAFSEGDILFAKITPCMENGKGAIADRLENGIGFGSTEFFVIRVKNESDRLFVYHLTLSEPFRLRAKRWMRGSAGQLRVAKDFFESLNLAVPKLEQRAAIGVELQKIEDSIDMMSQHKERVYELKKLLISTKLHP